MHALTHALSWFLRAPVDIALASTARRPPRSSYRPLPMLPRLDGKVDAGKTVLAASLPLCPEISAAIRTRDIEVTPTEQCHLPFYHDDGGGGSGVRLLVANDDTALLSLALAEMAAACADLSCSVARLSARCADPLLRQFDAPFAALVRGGLADLHRLRYSGARKWTGRCGICSGSWSAVLDAPDGRARPEKERLPRRGIGEEAERPDPSRVSGCDVRTARETDETRARVKASSKEKKTRYRCL
uniref:Uncharacterized protein n=1 Tax=Oryza meridionalis TaxID=40149 RepID=A0A0E0F411_9ORYZ